MTAAKSIVLAGLAAGACCLSIFASAGLLFVAEPLIGKLVLPIYGGTPAVWNACMVFYQVIFLAGYLYAHVLGQSIRLPVQVLLHLMIVFAGAFFLPLKISVNPSWVASGGENPIWGLLGMLSTSVALPLFAISATAPLVQRWFSLAGHERSHDPYFLYAASNLGSLLGLISFPFLIEPFLNLQRVIAGWQVAYLVFSVLLISSGMLLHVLKGRGLERQPAASITVTKAEKIRAGRWLYWIVLAFIPSSLMLGVTTYISTDVGAVPLLWVIPLALYLFSFILAFGFRLKVRSLLRERTLCLLALVLVIACITESSHPAWLLILMHLLMFWSAALVLHLQLASDRPSSGQLTEYYVCLAIGGALGGVFNSIIAPLLFGNISEYPLMMAAACMLHAGWRQAFEDFRSWKSLSVWIISLLILTTLLAWSSQVLGLAAGRMATLSIFLLPALLAYSRVNSPGLYGMLLLTLLTGSHFYRGVHGQTLAQERNFFGVLRVTQSDDFTTLVHGNTQHGKQNRSQPGCVPLSYYHSTGPAGVFFNRYNQQSDAAHSQIAAIGLGTGALACYALPTQEWTFFEINPAVTAIAKNERYFSFLTRSASQPILVREGDARLTLKGAEPGQYDLLILDAFSSDSIPVHLLTQEALNLYLHALDSEAPLLFHVSNRYLDLRHILARLGNQAGLKVFSWEDLEVTDNERAEGKDPSQWILMLRKGGKADDLIRQSGWIEIHAEAADRLWTDSYSDIFSVLKIWSSNHAN